MPCRDCQSNRPSPVTTTSWSAIRSPRPTASATKPSRAPAARRAARARTRARPPHRRRARPSSRDAVAGTRAASRSGRTASPRAAVAACAKWPSARSRSCACSGVAPFWAANPALAPCRPEQRDVDVGGDDELDAAQPVAQLAQPGEVVGGHADRASRRPRRGRPPVRHPERRAPDQSTRAGVVRRRAAEPDDDPSRPASRAAASSSPTPRLVVRVGSRGPPGPAARPTACADSTYAVVPTSTTSTAGARASPTGDGDGHRDELTAEQRAAECRRSRGRRRRAAARSPRRAAPSSRQRSGDGRGGLGGRQARAEAVGGDEHAHGRIVARVGGHRHAVRGSPA